MDSLILDLFNKECIKTGQFTLKNGETSPVYIDLKNIISYPFIVNKISNLIWEKIKDIEFDNICGVPYGGIPISSIISAERNIPMLMVRKEKKKYGMGKQIEGLYQKNCKCVLIEDVITTGSSLIAIIKLLKQYNINVVHIVVLCDRRGHNIKNLMCNQSMSSLFSIYDILNCLKDNNKIDYSMFNTIKDYVNKHESIHYSFEARKTLTTNTLTKKILTLMETKKTNLCFSADIKEPQKLIKVLNEIGDHICILKLHCDIIQNFNKSLVDVILNIANKKKFFIFEDRKFCDIGSTFVEQYTGGNTNIKNWSDLITVNCLSGEGIIKSFSKVNKGKKKGLLLIHDMSTKPNLITENYKNSIISFTEKYKKDIVGLITQKRDSGDDSILYMTPGVNHESKKDLHDQKYRTPDDAILRDNCDIIIVGRGIYNSEEPKKIAEIYKFLAWNAYTMKIKNTQVKTPN